MADEPLPILAVLTGRPGSGKTSLGTLLAPALRLPLIRRDHLKEGLIRTFGPGSLADAEANRRASEAFFEAIGGLIDRRISLIAEAAFQNAVWKPRLLPLLGRADVRMVICQTSPERAWERMLNRSQQDPAWTDFHPLPEFHRGAEEPYEAPQIDVPTLVVDTTGDFLPEANEIVAFLSRL